MIQKRRIFTVDLIVLPGVFGIEIKEYVLSDI
jgi:hypothetical protein